MIEATLCTLAEGRDLPLEEARGAFEAVMQGTCTDAEVASLLTALRLKGETIEELVGAATALRHHATPLETGRDDLLDTCGTGGDDTGTFNISTAAALVAAGAGVPVAKHGNRSVSSRSGSADVMAALGVNLEAPPAVVARCIGELGFGFCFAPLFHPAMRAVAAVRRQLRFRTIFNLVGPLANPAGAPHQLVGTGDPVVAEKLAGALLHLGVRRALVVCAQDGLDEVSLGAPTRLWVVEPPEVRTMRWTADSFGLAEHAVGELGAGSPDESAETIHRVLGGQTGAARDVVLANAAAALLAAGRAGDARQGVALAAEAIDQGRAADLLTKLAAMTNEPPPA